MTSNTFSGSMGGVYGADNFCRFDPANPAGTGRGNWKAMLTSNNPVRRACLSAGCAVAGAAENIDWVLRPNTPYKRADGAPVGTTSGNGIFQTTLTNSIGVIGVGVWTGLTLDWENNSLNCGNWFDGTSGPEGSIGTATGVINDAIASGTSFCNQGNYLYCVEQ
ncbi:MAG TPA: DUF1554 domain-containing protein [Turneriella sp.]|nr:DUF1554 domain-containing protein [Turneriella sp.]